MILTHVGAILASAVEDDAIAKNPAKAKSVRAPKADKQPIVPWTAEQVAHVGAAMPERYRILATLGAGLGLRQGEIFGLSPDDVDFLRGTVTVRDAR